MPHYFVCIFPLQLQLIETILSFGDSVERIADAERCVVEVMRSVSGLDEIRVLQQARKLPQYVFSTLEAIVFILSPSFISHKNQIARFTVEIAIRFSILVDTASSSEVLFEYFSLQVCSHIYINRREFINLVECYLSNSANSVCLVFF